MENPAPQKWRLLTSGKNPRALELCGVATRSKWPSELYPSRIERVGGRLPAREQSKSLTAITRSRIGVIRADHILFVRFYVSADYLNPRVNARFMKTGNMCFGKGLRSNPQSRN